MANDEIRIRMQGKKDQNRNDYYVAVTDMPSMISLDGTVFVLFPDESEDGKFGGDLVIRKYRGERPSKPIPGKRHPVRREGTPQNQNQTPEKDESNG